MSPELELEWARLRAEQDYRQTDLEREERKLRFPYLLKNSISSLIGPLIAAVAAIVGSYLVGSWNARAVVVAEKLKDQAGLIVEAMQGRSQNQAVVALQFLANAGMIPDYREAVLKLTVEKNGAAVPSSLPPEASAIPPMFRDVLKEVITLSNGVRMQLPPNLHCGLDRSHMIEHTFIPKVGEQLDCRMVVPAEVNAINFDEQIFEKYQPGSKAE